MTRRNHYEVRPTPDGRWAVCHQIPGLLHGLSVDVAGQVAVHGDVGQRQALRRRMQQHQDLAARGAAFAAVVFLLGDRVVVHAAGL
jgi:voltage-gated potassium channel Kch